MLEVAVERGQHVAQSQLLARLDDALELPERDLRAADLAAAQAQLRLLRAGTRREELRASASEIEALRATEETQAKNLARQQQLQAAGAATAQSIDELSSQLRASGERRRALEERFKALRIGARADEIAAAEARAQAASAALAAVERAARSATRCRARPRARSSTCTSRPARWSRPARRRSRSPTSRIRSSTCSCREGQHERHRGRRARRTLRVDGVASELGGTHRARRSRAPSSRRASCSARASAPNLVIRVRVRVDDPEHACCTKACPRSCGSRKRELTWSCRAVTERARS